MVKRVAIYLRVSTDLQTTDNQEPECRQLAERRGEVLSTYAEQGSAVKVRPEFARMMKDAKRGKFDVLVIWALDRFGRSMAGNMADLEELDRLGVQVVSVRESWLDTTGPTRGLLVAIFSWVAEQERERIAQRTKAGMARAKRHGTKSGRKIGRPKARVDIDEARRLLAEGFSQRTTAKALAVPLGTLQRALARAA
jgi:DNA invertase Pin-like site-specific DNA recombinase